MNHHIFRRKDVMPIFCPGQIVASNGEPLSGVTSEVQLSCGRTDLPSNFKKSEEQHALICPAYLSFVRIEARWIKGWSNYAENQAGGLFMSDKKIRNINQQMQYAINQCIHIGESKRQYRMDNNGSTRGRLFSCDNIDKFRGTAKSLAKFLNTNYPEVKLVRDIKLAHIQDWIDINDQWSKRTVEEKISQIKHLIFMIEKVYHCKVQCNPYELEKPDMEDQKVRIQAMDAEDVDLLRKSWEERKAHTKGKIALELSDRTGLRVKECAYLENEEINLEGRRLELRHGTKNGKFRDVPIRDKHYEYFAGLKEETKGNKLVCGGISRDAINKSIRREMKRVGIADKYIDTTVHAIRKKYARERYQEEIDKGHSRLEAWNIVQEELGHGRDFRIVLFKAYIGEKTDPRKDE